MIKGIIIGILIWQLISFTLIMIDEDNDKFKCIIAGIPCLIVFPIGKLINKLHIYDKHTYYRCKKILEHSKYRGNIKCDDTIYYCNQYDYYYTRFPHEDKDKSYSFEYEWLVMNGSKIKKKDIRLEHLKNWKEYKL